MFNVQRNPFLGALMWGLVHALLFGLAFPPVGWWLLVLVAPLPLLHVARVTERPFRSAVAVSIASIPMWALHHLWINEITVAGWPPLTLYLSIFPGLFIWALATVQRSFPRVPWWLLAPTMWVAVEMMRGEVVWHGYPWFMLGQPAIQTAIVRAVGTSFGLYGAALVLVLFACGIMAAGDTMRKKRSGAPLMGSDFLNASLPLFIAALLLGLSIWLTPPISLPREKLPPPLRVAVVQTNVPQSNKDFGTLQQRFDDFALAMRLTSEAAHLDPKPDVIVWPETMFPGNTLSPQAVDEERRSKLGYREFNYPLSGWHDDLVKLQGDLGIPMIVGAVAIDDLKISQDEKGVEFNQAARYNSSFLIKDGKVQPERYDKLFLTPFGETMPYISAWKWLEQKLLAFGANGMMFDLKAGERPVQLEIEVPAKDASTPARTVRVGTPICFEATMPATVRSLVVTADGNPAADALINLTNEGWFGRSDATRENHLLAARWRCVELGVPMVRCANTGISSAIDANGQVIARGPNVPGEATTPNGANIAGVMVVDLPIPVGPASTFYARHGNIAGWGCLAASGILLGFSLIRGPTGGTEKKVVSTVAPQNPEMPINNAGPVSAATPASASPQTATTPKQPPDSTP